MPFVVKDAGPESLPGILKVAEETGMFLGEELDFFQARLEQYFLTLGQAASPLEKLFAAWDESQPNAPAIGAIFAAPEAMAQGVANLLFLGVLQSFRGKGIGRLLLAHFEEYARLAGNRIAIIETADDPMFAPAWALYEKAGFIHVARIPAFYSDGLDKLVYWKQLSAPPEGE